MKPLPRSRLIAIGLVTVALLAVSVVALTAATTTPMIARAGGDHTFQCTSPAGALVPLDATASRPATNDTIRSYTWYEGHNTSAQRVLGEGARINVTLALGSHLITLRVSNGTNGTNATAWDNATIRVVDTIAPIVTVTPSISTLGPPNHKAVNLTMRVSVSDACTAAPGFTLRSVTSNQPDDGIGDGHTVGDIQGASPGTPDTDFSVNAERAGPGGARVYTFTYESRDASGNVGVGTATVTVPHS